MAKKRRKNVTVGFVALGCPKNVVDSEKMLADIAQAGFIIMSEPEKADVVVINTCGFIAPAKAESVRAIAEAVACKRKGKVRRVIVAGCLSERSGRELLKEISGIDAVVGLGERDNLPEIINKTLSSAAPTAHLAGPSAPISDDRGRLLIGPGHRAYLRISEGCNHRCSFCTIPAIRGHFRSKPVEIVLAEAAELVSAGAVELSVIAQDSTCYGRDLATKVGLSDLIKRLDELRDLRWIRLMYLNPGGIDEKLIETIAESRKVVHYVDMPIQHVSAGILKAMRRQDTPDRLARLLEKLRSAIPDVVLRTTMIVGFPGETDEQFGELIRFVKWAKFDALGCFEFYPEAGTTAADLPAQIPEHVKQQRQEELMLAQQKIAFAKNRDRVGSPLTCLVETIDSQGTGQGRFYGQAPEIDSVCVIGNCSAEPGQFIDTMVVDTQDYDLIVEQTQHQAAVEI
ncbi:MAG: 30S ribosomal protein S12 methylthiotransferase RimO [Phycisphaerales bacterium]|nr:MAG: 30S ribosomal protein S12 methylthiotransferase RimO [Phycisphaerales bacterium]